jgi:hypothetical protein
MERTEKRVQWMRVRKAGGRNSERWSVGTGREGKARTTSSISLRPLEASEKCGDGRMEDV